METSSQQLCRLTLYVYNDEDKLFILSLVEEMKRMTNEQKTVFKLNAWQIIDAIQAEEGQSVQHEFKSRIVGHFTDQDVVLQSREAYQQYKSGKIAAGRVKNKDSEYLPEFSVGQDNDEDMKPTIDHSEYDKISAGRVRNKDLEYLPDINDGQDNNEDSDATMVDSEYELRVGWSAASESGGKVAVGRVRNKNLKYPSDINDEQDNDGDNKPLIDDSIYDKPQLTCEANLIDESNPSVPSSATRLKTEDQEPVTLFNERTKLDNPSEQNRTGQLSRTCVKGFACTVCSVTFNQRNSLVRHMRSHTGEKPFACSQCAYRSYRSDKLRNHMLSHTAGKHELPPDINLLEESNPLGNLLSGMMIKTEDQDEINSASESAEFDNPSDQKRKSLNSSNSKRRKHSSVTHINRLSVGHRNEVNDVNSQSSAVLDGNQTMKSRVKKEKLKRTRSKLFLCKLCSYQCSHSSHLSRHMLRHTGEKPFTCTQCSCRFGRSDALAKHMRSHAAHNTDSSGKHNMPTKELGDTGEKQFTCAQCSFRCDKSDELAKHMLTHTGEKPFLCTICPHRYNRSSHLARHMLSHSGEKPFLCTVCPYRCGTSNELKAHVRSHTGEKPFACTVCSYRCSQNSNLTAHMRKHTGEKPFLCTICPHQCRRSSDLARHMQSHTGLMPISCTLCTYQCARTDILTRHMRSHTGEKPFACTLCSHRCSQSNDLARHMARHTKLSI